MSHEIVPASPIHHVPASPIHHDEFYDAVPALPSSSGHEADESNDTTVLFTRSLTYREHVPQRFESERLPSTLASDIQKFLRVANLIESEEPRIAYLCKLFFFLFLNLQFMNLKYSVALMVFHLLFFYYLFIYLIHSPLYCEVRNSGIIWMLVMM